MSDKFNKLKKIDSKLDKLCIEKRLHTEAEHLKRIKCTKTLRLFIKSTISNSVFIRIDSRVINDFKNHEVMKITDLIKRMCVIFNSDLESTLDYYNKILNNKVDEQVENDDKIKPSSNLSVEIFEWNKTDNESINSFELRSNNYHINNPLNNIKILIEFENKRNLYKLSRVLREIINKFTDSKPNAITALWKYIHKNGLIKPGEIEIKADDKLKKLVNKDKFLFTDIPEIITDHLCPIDNLVIDIPTDSFYKEIFDIPIEVDDLYHLPRVHSKEVYNYEKKIEMLIEFKKRLKDKKDILSKFSNNPIEFINRWICLDSTDYYTKTQFVLNKSVQDLLYEMIEKLPY
ncbi:SWI/SNF complex component SNF12 [Nosema bombycis CQ1]|uniref:SWI/SNF complex component SNF12 n=1 Tax=Nosema bombycis (strain CQ1 / CVCC 102059) TaxID=578461 RepID=R0MFV1_NOSB1|nr:SWI/SNF complex component SNF12 [Nosema bombycis CQ1]|eukprot:EOB11638.1 SWI/SNF complex component SNF12 [Nosema bombycis CQ1]